MLSKEEKKRLLDSLKSLKSDISKLRNLLNDKNIEKEALFQKKENITKQIHDIIKDVKALRKERDRLTTLVKQLKKERDSLSASLNSKIGNVKKLQQEKNTLVKKYNIKGDPSIIKGEIEKLEQKIETEVMSFEKEKGIMKDIKAKKKQLDDAKGLSLVLEKIYKLSDEIKDAKRKRENKHKSIQSFAAESQKKHEELIEKSKKIDELRVKEEDIYKKFFDVKKEFSNINDKLKGKLVELNNIKGKLDIDKKETIKKHNEKQKKELMDKAEKVDEKIKKRKKLTTKDLLIFQKTVDDLDTEEKP